MRAEIRRGQGFAEVKSNEGCYILEVSNDPGDEEVSIARARVEPGVTTRWHRLRQAAERYVIVSGKGLVEIRGVAPAGVESGDVVRIPPGAAQRITNTGEGDLLFYCVCSPRFRAEDYEDLEVSCNG